MENNSNNKVCVTGGSGYLGSWMIKKLLEKGFTVHATLRNLGENTKTGLLKSLPNAETKLKLFQADIYNPQEFEPAIQGCQYVLHMATPMVHTQHSMYKDRTEAAIAGAKSIADSCVRSQTVKRLVYTGSVMAASPMREDGSGYKPQMDELCWTPLNLDLTYKDDSCWDYTQSKTQAEKEILRYNNETGIEVVSLACGNVGGETLLSYIPASLHVVLSQLTCDKFSLNAIRLLQELSGSSVPLIHINDVCNAHVFCIEKTSLKGRFICASECPTMEDIANCYQEIHPEFQIPEELKIGAQGRSICDVTKLRTEGFEFKYGLKEILKDSVKCAKRLRVL